MKKNLLYIDCCIRGKESRTEKLAQALLETLQKTGQFTVQECNLQKDPVLPMDYPALQRRDKLLNDGRFDDKLFEMAHIFAEADVIVCAVPYWDLLFPAEFRAYLERICVCGITFKSTDKGLEGLCRCSRLYYITTAGGFIGNADFGYQYIKGLAGMLGIRKTECFCADGLDIAGLDASERLGEAVRKIHDDNFSLL